MKSHLYFIKEPKNSIFSGSNLDMKVYEPKSYLDVETPMGRGNIWLVKDYGLEMDTYYTVVIREGDH
jgi:hypothetical protein